MAEESHSLPLLEALVKLSRIPRFWFITIVNAVLLLLQIPVALLDSMPTALRQWAFWRSHLDDILLITFILIAYPFMLRLREKAVYTFKPLLSIDDNDFDKLAANIARPNRLWEWAAIFLGIAFAFGIGQPWNLDWVSGYFWLHIYTVIIVVMLWGVVGWLIYDTLAGIMCISRLSRQNLKLDILDTEILTPIARWSLGISLIFVGGISLSLIFTTWEELKEWNSITIYAVMVCITVLVFFLSMWSAHRAMADAKKRTLAIARKHLVAISRELEDRTQQDQLIEIGDISSSVTSWASYQRLVQEAPTWPFSAGIIRRFLASIIVPAIVYLIKILSGLGLRF